MSQLLEEYTPSTRVGAISGPNFAEEIADQQYTGTVIATRDAAAGSLVQEVMRSDTLRVYASSDVYGVELAGALKEYLRHYLWPRSGLRSGTKYGRLIDHQGLGGDESFCSFYGWKPLYFPRLSRCW